MPYYAGLDLGQSADYTALSIVHDTHVWDEDLDKEVPSLQLVHLERYEQGTSYVDIVDHVTERVLDPKLHPWERDMNTMNHKQTHPTLIVDQTGVGAPVTDLFAKKGVRFVGVTITGGDNVITAGSRKYRVPKRDLVSALVVPFHSGELLIAEDLDLWPVLKKELLNFKRKINLKTAHDSYEHWREGDHDDLVLATSLAVWFCRRKTKGTRRLKVIR
jgi:hypothetical protein